MKICRYVSRGRKTWPRGSWPWPRGSWPRIHRSQPRPCRVVTSLTSLDTRKFFSSQRVINTLDENVVSVGSIDAFEESRVTIHPGFPGHVLFLSPCPGGFPGI